MKSVGLIHCFIPLLQVFALPLLVRTKAMRTPTPI